MSEKTPRPSKRPKSPSKNPGRAEPIPSVKPRAQPSVPAARSERRSEPVTRRAERPRPLEPEIRVAIAPAGRDTLDAIAEELSPKKGARPRLRSYAESAPEITIETRPAGRDTLAAINEELTSTRPRESLPTLPYGDRVPNAPGARTPSRPPSSSPKPGKRKPAVGVANAEIFEMRTFVLQKADAQSLEDQAERVRFVTERLAHHLPGGSAAGVTRVDMTPWTESETLILRVWCRVEPHG
ncbi:MAG: hypothetical protein ACOY0T_23440 [Myxococcota bacterium]